MKKSKCNNKKGIKFILGVAVGVVLSMALTACGGNDAPPATTAPTTAPATTTAPPQTTAPPVAAEPSIVGTWEWVDDFTYRYVFNANGTGTRGFGANTVMFEWYAEGSYLDIYIPAFIEEWVFAIEDDILVISSLQVPGLTFAYAWQGHVEEGTTFPLDGAWIWVDNGVIQDFEYIFFSDGSGIRGNEWLFEVFYWAAVYEDGAGVLEIYSPGVLEEWDFDMTADTLTIFSPDLPGVRFIYNRIN